MSHRYFIKLAYKGSEYHGWQIQKNAANTVQQLVNDAVSRILVEKIETIGAGRTDTGVHARTYYAHFDSVKEDLNDNASDWVYKMNCVLPNDIVIHQLIPVAASTHARFDAVSRTYEYQISKNRNPFYLDSAYYLFQDLNMDAMNEASKALLNFSDFSCFSKSNTQVKTNNCKIYFAGWEQRNDLLIFTITADRFLRNMVRAIVGTMLDVGRGKMELSDFYKIIEGKNRSDAGFSVPACGLFLCKIEYPVGLIGDTKELDHTPNLR